VLLQRETTAFLFVTMRYITVPASFSQMFTLSHYPPHLPTAPTTSTTNPQNAKGIYSIEAKKPTLPHLFMQQAHPNQMNRICMTLHLSVSYSKQSSLEI
jgi:hypothetical protein